MKRTSRARASVAGPLYLSLCFYWPLSPKDLHNQVLVCPSNKELELRFQFSNPVLKEKKRDRERETTPGSLLGISHHIFATLFFPEKALSTSSWSLETPGPAGNVQGYSSLVYLVWLGKLPKPVRQMLAPERVLEDWVLVGEGLGEQELFRG